jgi:hypothetical protein
MPTLATNDGELPPASIIENVLSLTGFKDFQALRRAIAISLKLFNER